jgi:thioredoxin-related protein
MALILTKRLHGMNSTTPNKNNMIRFIFSLTLLFTITFASAQDKINWMTWEEAIAANKKSPKKIFIDVYTDWCGWCKRMDATTFEDPAVIKTMNELYYAIKFDAEQKAEITLKDKTYKFVPNGRRGYHELAAAILNGKMSYPSSVFLDKSFNMIQPLAGYQDGKTLNLILTYLGTDVHKTTSWTDYSAKNK